MGNKTLIYKKKLLDNLNIAKLHLKRLEKAVEMFSTKYSFPLKEFNFEDEVYLAYADQIIYRFSKLQDTIGAKLFKSLLLYEGEDVNRPFLDILNELEKLGIVDVEEWFEMRDLRNEIAHEYDNSEEKAIEILNLIVEYKDVLKTILEKITNLVKA